VESHFATVGICSLYLGDLSDDAYMDLYALVDGKELTAPFMLTTYADWQDVRVSQAMLAWLVTLNLFSNTIQCHIIQCSPTVHIAFVPHTDGQGSVSFTWICMRW